MDIIMPQLGETVAEGTLTVWHKSEGDDVVTNELLFEIGTDKVEMEVPAPVSGKLEKIFVKAGETVEVGAVLGRINSGDASNDDQSSEESEKSPASSPNNLAEKQYKSNLSLSDHLSPAVRRLIAEHKLDSSKINGTGRDGRIKKSDVLEYMNANKNSLHELSPGSQNADEPKFIDGKSIIPFSRIRQVTAEHMVRSKTISPHVNQGIEVDFSKVDSARKSTSSDWKEREGFSLTYLPFIIKALCGALADFPNLNSHIEENNLIVFKDVQLAVAVDLGLEGLVTPVIRDISSLSVTEIARSVSSIASLARKGSLKPEDFKGGTYTVTNNGALGTLYTTPIINQPQVGVLSVDGVAKRPIVVDRDGEDNIVVRPIGVITQAFDHRAIDGAYSAAFLKRLKDIIENHDWTSLLS